MKCRSCNRSNILTFIKSKHLKWFRYVWRANGQLIIKKKKNYYWNDQECVAMKM